MDAALPTTIPDRTDSPVAIAVAGNGNMGLRGLWALVGNSTAMVVIAVAMLLTMYAAWSMHQSGMSAMKEMNDRAFEVSQRQADTLTRVVDRNTDALGQLTREIHLLRSKE